MTLKTIMFMTVQNLRIASFKSKVIFKQRLIDDIDKPFKYISIELLEDHYIDDLSLNALKIFLE